MKILITGGLGFIGCNFVKYYNEKYSESVVILDDVTYAATCKSISNNIVVKGNICDANIVESVMEGVDIVVHFAAETHVDNSIKNSTPFIQSNIVGTHVLLEAARKHKVKRFHHISTDEVFGSLDLNSNIRFTENTSYNPRSPYSASKASSDHLVRAYYHTYKLPVTISNCSNNYGPHQHTEKLIPLVINNILAKKSIPVYGTGLNIRDWIYVKDHCEAIDTILNQGVVGETYLVGGNCELCNLDIIRLISDKLDVIPQIEFVEDRKGHDARYAIDCSKLEKLGWKPRTNISDGLEKAIEFYK